MDALVLEKKRKLSLRDFPIEETVGPDDVRIEMHTVGICGSDLHYYLYGSIGPFVVREPMILGHEASGTVVEVGANVKNLATGDRVCMEPGIPDPNSRATRLGIYNLDPAVTFWATPPVHGCMRTTVVHPAAFTFKLPETVSYAEGAMVEPLAVGMHAANKAQIKPGDTALVIGAGTIGMVTIMAALAGGCSRVIVSDVEQSKLDLAATFGAVTPVNMKRGDLGATIDSLTDGWGVDIVFEASGNEKVAPALFDHLCPGGTVVYIGMPSAPVSLDIVAAQAKEARIETIFRYAHVYPRALALMGSGKIDVKPLLTDTYPFAESIAAYTYAAKPKPGSVKTQIVMKA